MKEKNNDAINVNDIQFFEKPKELSQIFCDRDKRLTNEFENTQKNIHYETTIYAKDNLIYVKGKLVISGASFYVIEINEKYNFIKPEVPKPLDEFHPLVSLNFNLVTAKLTYNLMKQKFQIFVLGKDEPFKFESKLPMSEFQTLLKTIQTAIINSLGHSQNLIGVSLRKDFHLNYYITEKEFLSKVKTGDVLVFRGLECPAKSQRFFTRAEYDHVGLLLKRGIDVWVYEATSKDGCKARTWREFSIYGWTLLYEKMTYRELIVNLPEKERSKVLERTRLKLEEFVAITEKKKYRLTACGLCCKLNSQEYEKRNEWKKAKGFFCSQLVIASYLHSGIIKYNSDTRSYLPGTFSRDFTLPFKEGFGFGPENIIEFSE